MSGRQTAVATSMSNRELKRTLELADQGKEVCVVVTEEEYRVVRTAFLILDAMTTRTEG